MTTRAAFSNTGGYVSLVAPGENVFSAVSADSSPGRFPRVALTGAQAGLYGYASGTSFSAPEVAGAAGEDALASITLGAFLERHPLMTRATPASSSWGAGGYGEVWIGPESSKLWRHVHHASRYVTWLVDNYRTRIQAVYLAEACGRAPRPRSVTKRC